MVVSNLNSVKLRLLFCETDFLEDFVTALNVYKPIVFKKRRIQS